MSPTLGLVVRPGIEKAVSLAREVWRGQKAMDIKCS